MSYSDHLKKRMNTRADKLTVRVSQTTTRVRKIRTEVIEMCTAVYLQDVYDRPVKRCC